MENGLPSVFCWSKIGTESGVDIERILRRKEHERRAGAGLFLWGIGNSVAAAARILSDHGPLPVIFTHIRGKAAKIDRLPSGVLAWLDYVDGEFKRPLPRGAFVTTRDQTLSGKPKTRHYALFCRTSRPLAFEHFATFDASDVRNLLSGAPVGGSQNTSVVEYAPTATSMPHHYEVCLRAYLETPYCALLASPVALKPVEIAALDNSLVDETAYNEATSRIKAAARERLDAHGGQMGNSPAAIL